MPKIRPKFIGAAARHGARPECPNQAIYMGVEIYEIDPDKCTECVGHFDEPQCVQVCPVACIPVNPQHVESSPTLWQKYHRLQALAVSVTGTAKDGIAL